MSLPKTLFILTEENNILGIPQALVVDEVPVAYSTGHPAPSKHFHLPVIMAPSLGGCQWASSLWSVITCKLEASALVKQLAGVLSLTLAIPDGVCSQLCESHRTEGFTGRT